MARHVVSVQESLRSTDTIVRTILPALKTFPSNEVAIVGCHASGHARSSCEYDLLIVSRDPFPEKVVGMQGSYARLIFRNEVQVRHPRPDLAVALASAIPLRDNSLLLATAVSECRRNYAAICASLMETHLASSLKAAGRVDELLAVQEAMEADFWLLSAAHEFASAALLSFEVSPSPSHTLTQMKGLSGRMGTSFKSWVDAAGLELASRASCENRLESLGVIYDVLSTNASSQRVPAEVGRYRDPETFQMVKVKADALIASMESVEGYSYLGAEVVKSIVDLYSLHAARLGKSKDYTSMIRDLATRKDRLISEDVFRSLGLVRSQGMLEVANEGLKAAVSALAKKI